MFFSINYLQHFLTILQDHRAVEAGMNLWSHLAQPNSWLSTWVLSSSLESLHCLSSTPSQLKSLLVRSNVISCISVSVHVLLAFHYSVYWAIPLSFVYGLIHLTINHVILHWINTTGLQSSLTSHKVTPYAEVFFCGHKS